MRKAIALVAVLVLASASYGATFSFENTDDGFNAASPGISGYSTTIGVTDGTYSAIVANPGGWGFRVANSDGATLVPLMDANTGFTMDVTAADPLQVFIQFSTEKFTWNSPYLSVAGGNVPTTLTFDYSAAHVPGSGWAWFKIGLNGGPAQDVMLDNITFTPEPATMALLAFGGIAALIRRKR